MLLNSLCGWHNLPSVGNIQCGWPSNTIDQVRSIGEYRKFLLPTFSKLFVYSTVHTVLWYTGISWYSYLWCFLWFPSRPYFHDKSPDSAWLLFHHHHAAEMFDLKFSQADCFYSRLYEILFPSVSSCGCQMLFLRFLFTKLFKVFGSFSCKVRVYLRLTYLRFSYVLCHQFKKSA